MVGLERAQKGERGRVVARAVARCDHATADREPDVAVRAQVVVLGVRHVEPALRRDLELEAHPLESRISAGNGPGSSRGSSSSRVRAST
jgi:hypothetical protein